MRNFLFAPLSENSSVPCSFLWFLFRSKFPYRPTSIIHSEMGGRGCIRLKSLIQSDKCTWVPTEVSVTASVSEFRSFVTVKEEEAEERKHSHSHSPKKSLHLIYYCIFLECLFYTNLHAHIILSILSIRPFFSTEIKPTLLDITYINCCSFAWITIIQ